MKRRTRALLAASLIGTPLIASTSATPHASADDSGLLVTYSLDRAPGPQRLCTAENLQVTLSVVQHVRSNKPEDARADGLKQEQDGVVIVATSSDPAVIGIPTPNQVTGFDNSKPPEATFTLHAKQPGVATITYVAHIADMADLGTLRGELKDQKTTQTLTVTNCTFEVNVGSNFEGASGGLLTIFGLIDTAKLVSDDDGASQATVPVKWTVSEPLDEYCGGRVKVANSTATLSGHLDSTGELTIVITYDPIPGAFVATCGGFTKGLAESIKPSTLTIVTTSKANRGKLTQDLVGPEYGTGDVLWVVTPTDVEEH